jgi:hypothetical protein
LAAAAIPNTGVVPAPLPAGKDGRLDAFVEGTDGGFWFIEQTASGVWN